MIFENNDIESFLKNAPLICSMKNCTILQNKLNKINITEFNTASIL